ncbi:unnamed protein product, partial [Phaeothamnion confervicola]
RYRIASLARLVRPSMLPPPIPCSTRFGCGGRLARGRPGCDCRSRRPHPSMRTTSPLATLLPADPFSERLSQAHRHQISHCARTGAGERGSLHGACQDRGRTTC